MGGVWFTNDSGAIAWRWAFMDKIQQQEMVTSDTPISEDFELSGTIGHADVLTQHAQVEGETIHTFCDNTPAVSW